MTAPPSLLQLIELFLQWQPIAPRTARELANVTARLCRLLRDEVVEALARKAEALTTLATDWRGLLFRKPLMNSLQMVMPRQSPLVC